MKKDCNRCPGCSRHCCLDAPKCKYGCKYRQKICEGCSRQENTKKHKWEKYVQADSSLWQLITVGRRAKKALVKRKATQQSLLSALSPDEQASLCAILNKINAAMEGGGQ